MEDSNSMLKKAARLRRGYGGQASGVLNRSAEIRFATSKFQGEDRMEYATRNTNT